jgi:hypothetical protein
MLCIHRFLITSVGVLLLLAVAGPAAAKPAPFENGTGDPGSRPGTSVDSGTSLWAYTGLALLVVLAVALVAAIAIAIDRHHSHHAPHPV